MVISERCSVRYSRSGIEFLRHPFTVKRTRRNWVNKFCFVPTLAGQFRLEGLNSITVFASKAAS